MSSYNLGTASGRIEIDGKAGAAGFKVVETAADTMFKVIQNKVASVEQLGRRMRLVGGAGVAGFGVAIRAAANFEQQMSAVQAVTNTTGDEFDSLKQKALDLGAKTVFSASEAAQAIEELAKAGIPVKDILNGAADGAVALAAAGGIGLAEASTIAANAMNQFGIDASKVTDVADILAGVANTSAADVSSIGQSLSQAGAVANLAGLSFRDTAIAIGEMSDAGINGSDAGTSLKTMLNNLIPVTSKQTRKFRELGLLQGDLAQANKDLVKEGLPVQKNMEGVTDVLAKYFDKIGVANKGTVRMSEAIQDFQLKTGALSNQFFKTNGDIKDLAGIQGTLSKALKGMTKEQKLSTLETLFGADAMRATAILSLAGAKGYNKFSEAVGKTTAADVAATRLDNFAGSIEALQGSFETSMITIGNIFLPVVTKVINGITAILNAFNSLPEGVKTAIGIIVLAGAVLATLIGTILASITAISLFVLQWYAMRAISIATGYLKGFIAMQRTGIGVMAAHNAALATSAARTTRIGRLTLLAGKAFLFFGRMAAAAWALATGPVGIAVAAIAALVAIGVLLYKKWTPFRNIVDAVASILKDKFAAAMERVRPVIAAVGAAFVRFGNYVKSSVMPVLREVGGALLARLIAGFQKLSNYFSANIVPAFNKLKTAFSGAGDAGGSLLTKLAPAIGAIQKMATAVGGFLLPILRKMGEIFVSFILPILIKVAGFLGGVLIDTLVGLVKAVMQVVTGVITFFSGLITFITGVFSGNWSKAWEGIKQMFSGILNVIVGLVKVWMYASVLKLFAVGFALVRGIVFKGLTLVRGLFSGILRGILVIIRGAWRLFTGIIRGGMSTIRAIVTKVWGAIRTSVRSILQAIWNFIKSAWRGITGTVRNAQAVMKAVISAAWTAIKAVFTRAWTAIRTTVSNGITKIVELAKGIKGKITGAIGDAKTWLVDKGKEIIQGLINGVLSMVDKVKDAMGKVTGAIGKLIPGSPVKEGALKVLNKGRSGKEMVNFLVSGIEAQGPDLIATASRMSALLAAALTSSQPAIQTYSGATLVGAGATASRPSPSAVRPTGVQPAKVAKKKQSPSGMRLVEGRLHLDESGRAFIAGVAEDVYDTFEEDNNRRNR